MYLMVYYYMNVLLCEFPQNRHTPSKQHPDKKVDHYWYPGTPYATSSGTIPYSVFLCHRLILPIFILYIIRIIEYTNFWVWLWFLTL